MHVTKLRFVGGECLWTSGFAYANDKKFFVGLGLVLNTRASLLIDFGVAKP